MGKKKRIWQKIDLNNSNTGNKEQSNEMSSKESDAKQELSFDDSERVAVMKSRIGNKKKVWPKIDLKKSNTGNKERSTEVSSKESDVKQELSFDDSERFEVMESLTGNKNKVWHKNDSKNSNRGTFEVSSKETDVKPELSLDSERVKVTEPHKSEESGEKLKVAAANVIVGENQHGNDQSNLSNTIHNSRTFRRSEISIDLSHITHDSRNDTHHRQFTLDNKKIGFRKSESGNYLHDKKDFSSRKEYSENYVSEDEPRPPEEIRNHPMHDRNFHRDNRYNAKELYRNDEKSNNEERYAPKNKEKNFRDRDKGYHGGNNDRSSLEQSGIATSQNSNYNRNKYNADDNVYHNNKNHVPYQSNREMGKSSGGNMNHSAHSAENRSFGRGNSSYNNFRGGRRRGFYHNEMGDRRYNERRTNYNHNFSRRTGNSYQEGSSRTNWGNAAPREYSNEKRKPIHDSPDWDNVKNAPVEQRSDHDGGWSNATSRDYSNEKKKPLHYSPESMDNFQNAPTEETEDWDVPDANQSGWEVQNISSSAPDAQGTTSHLNDSNVATSGALDRVPVISPGSSKLNPHASSFHLIDQNQKWSEKSLVEESEVTINKDKYLLGQSNEMETKNDSGVHTDGAPPVRFEKQEDEAVSGPISNKNNEGNWEKSKNKHGKRRTTRNDDKYGGITSAGSNVDQNISQTSDVSYDDPRSDGLSRNDSSAEDRSPRHVALSRRSMDLYFDSSAVKDDDEWAEFKTYLDSDRAGRFVKVTEEEKDLFTVGEDYSLAHCVAEDMNMGSGIAVEFRRKFKQVSELLKMRERAGGLAVLEDKDRFIYYMVTKKISSGKPTYGTFWNSLKKLRDHMEKNEVKKLAIPRIGCGLDRLEWKTVKAMLEFVFRSTNVFILVCNFQQEDSFNSPNVQRSRKCRIVNENYPITDIEQGTIIVYFASSDGKPTPTMMELDKKFNFLLAFKRERKNLGDVVRFEHRTKNYIFYGCIVKEKIDDLFDFVQFGRCLSIIQRNNRKDDFAYVGFQRIEDDRDDILNDKLLNIMGHSLRDVDIYCCNSIGTPLNDSMKAG